MSVMSRTEINDAVEAITKMRPSSGKLRLLDVDRALREIEMDKLEKGAIEPELRGCNFIQVNHRYSSDKQLESARSAAKNSSFGRFTTDS